MHLLNQTKRAFISIGIFGINFVGGYAEEITFNLTNFTGANPANAMDVIKTLEVPDSQMLIKKSACVTGAALTSSAVKNRIVRLISGATFTGLL